jgi:hypothetical protein
MSIKNQVIKPVLLLFLFVGISCSSDKLTELQVKSVLDDIKTGVEIQNSDYIVNLLAEDVKIDITMSPSLGGQRMLMNKSEYKIALDIGWEMGTQLSYKIEDTTISMNADLKSANVTAVVMEATKMMEKIIYSKTYEKVTIRLIDGKPLITHITARIELDTPS